LAAARVWRTSSDLYEFGENCKGGPDEFEIRNSQLLI
jgi:hypothetical protein